MSRAERGVSLIELIIFIVVVGVAVVGVLAAINVGTRSSADPMVQKQALAAAEALLEEVQLQAFTICDPDDPAAAEATGPGDCTGGAAGPNDETNLPLGPETGETRQIVGTATPFDHVSDYNNFDSNTVGGIRDVSGALIPALAGYRARITVTPQAISAIPAAQAVLIQVTVDGPQGTDLFVVLDGYRVRYAPNAVP
jgi:MSHA pilin protein MshD